MTADLGLPLRHPEPRSVAHRLTRRSDLGLHAIAVGAVTVFVVQQLRAAVEVASFGGPYDAAYVIAFALGPYVALLTMAALVIACERPLLAPVPPTSFVVLSWLATGHYTNAIVGTWHSWSMATLALSTALLIVPCALAAITVRPRHAPPPLPAATVLVAASLVALVVVLRGIVDGQPWTSSASATVVSAFAGLICTRWRLVPIAVLAALLLHADPLAWLASGFTTATPIQSIAFATAPVLAGVSGRSLGLLVQRRSFPAWSLLVTVNVLNVADALATASAIASDRGRESNPIIDVLGLPGKVAIGLVASVVVARYRPRALLVPIAVLALVLCWHLAGLHI